MAAFTICFSDMEVSAVKSIIGRGLESSGVETSSVTPGIVVVVVVALGIFPSNRLFSSVCD